MIMHTVTTLCGNRGGLRHGSLDHGEWSPPARPPYGLYPRMFSAPALLGCPRWLAAAPALSKKWYFVNTCSDKDFQSTQPPHTEAHGGTDWERHAVSMLELLYIFFISRGEWTDEQAFARVLGRQNVF